MFVSCFRRPARFADLLIAFGDAIDARSEPLTCFELHPSGFLFDDVRSSHGIGINREEKPNGSCLHPAIVQSRDHELIGQYSRRRTSP